MCLVKCWQALCWCKCYLTKGAGGWLGERHTSWTLETAGDYPREHECSSIEGWGAAPNFCALCQHIAITLQVLWVPFICLFNVYDFFLTIHLLPWVKMSYLYLAYYRCVWGVPLRILHWEDRHTTLYCGVHYCLWGPQPLCKHSKCSFWSPALLDPSPSQTHI